MTAPDGLNHWTITVRDSNGNKHRVGIGVVDGQLEFNNAPRRFRISPDGGDVLAPIVQAAADIARRQRRS